MITDPYLTSSYTFQRLLNDYNNHGKNLIVAFDFDDTVYDFHKKGFKYDQVVTLLKRCNERGFRLVVFTANKDTEFVASYCDEIGIEIEGINKCLVPEFETAGKIFYNIFLDDRAGLKDAYETLKLLLDWTEVNESKSN